MTSNLRSNENSDSSISTLQTDLEQENIREEVEKRIAEELAAMPDVAEKIDMEKLVLTCLQYSSRGDAVLYAHIHKNKFLYNATSGEMMIWSGHSWEKDKFNLHYAAVDQVADLYAQTAENLWEKILNSKDPETRRKFERQQQLCNKRAHKLNGPTGRDACIKFVKTMSESQMSVMAEIFDSNPMLLGCANGVMELRTGKFRAGRQSDYISKACPTEFKGLYESAPMWEQALEQIFDGDKEFIAYLQRLFGYGITGLVDEHIFPVFQGRGRNGKSMIIEVLNYILGDLCQPIRSEMLLAQPANKNAAAPSPEIMALKGLRLAVASEVDERSAFSAAQVKLFTGGDALTGRNPHDKAQTHFKPSHLLILLTNDKPKAPGSDFAFWERVHLVEFPLSFVSEPKEKHERPAIRGLAEKLKKEAPGILAWLLRGCLQWQVDEGLNPPEKVKTATAEYQKEEDLLAGFIEDCCVLDPMERTRSKILYDCFEKWFVEKVGARVPKPKSFGKWMGKKFDKIKSNGQIYYNGVRLFEPGERLTEAQEQET